MTATDIVPGDRTRTTRWTRAAIVLVIVATLIRAALASVVPLFPDETYYWDWSRHLAAGYFDHPPAIAILIRGGTAIFGATPFGVRVGVVLAGAVASLAVVVTAGRLATSAGVARGDAASPLDDAEFRCALLLLVIPAALVGFVLATPDAPLLAAIALTLAALERAIAMPARSRASFGWWCAAGLMLGIAFCSKLTAVLLPLGVLIALASHPQLRRRLADPGPYAAAVISLLVLAPTIVWNARHQWVSIAFQLQHGLGRTHGSATSRELNLIGGQLGLVTPILAVLAVMVVAYALNRARDTRRYMFAVVATTVIAFFMLSALRKPVEANWPFPALVAALPLLATWEPRRIERRWLTAGIMLAVACTLVVTLQAAFALLPLGARRDPMGKAHGWDDLASAVAVAQRSQAAACPATWIAADRYQEASELAFHLPAHPRVFALNLGGRRNQYDLWPTLYSVAQPQDCALVVVDSGAGGEAVMRRLGATESRFLGIAPMRWRGVRIAAPAIWLARGIPSAPSAIPELSAGARAALDSARTAFASRSVLLDSLVRVYRRGPAPTPVTVSDSESLSNADRRKVIAERMAAVHDLLRRASVAAIYRDARYRDCTFVRTATPPGMEVGYVFTPTGCVLANGRGDVRLEIERVRDSTWSVFAAR